MTWDDQHSWRQPAAMRQAVEEAEMGNHSAALADFTKAIELQPEDGNNYAWRGRYYQQRGEIDNAAADFAQVETLLDENGWPPFYVAGGYALVGQVEEACRWLRLAFERDGALVAKVGGNEDFDAIREAAEFKALVGEGQPSP